MAQEKEGASRRDFLKLAATTAPAAAVLTATGSPAEADETVESAGLRKTPHVEAYLASARF